MHVLHRQDERLALRLVADKLPQEGEGPSVPRLWTELRQPLRGHRQVEELEQDGHVLLCHASQCCQPVPHGRRARHHRFPLGDGTDLLEELAHGQVWRHLAVCQTLPAIPRHLVRWHTAAKFGEQPRLACPRISHQTDRLAVA